MYMTFAKTDSKVLGYNNDSGMLYRTNNGLKQYALKNPRMPSWSAPQPEYVNEKNEAGLLEQMQDTSTDEINPNGRKDIATLPNSDLMDGGFENRGMVATQTDAKTVYRLRVPAKVVDLSTGDTGGLPTKEAQPPRGESQAMSQFGSFLNGLSLNIKPVVKRGPSARYQ